MKRLSLFFFVLLAFGFEVSIQEAQEWEQTTALLNKEQGVVIIQDVLYKINGSILQVIPNPNDFTLDSPISGSTSIKKDSFLSRKLQEKTPTEAGYRLAQESTDSTSQENISNEETPSEEGNTESEEGEVLSEEELCEESKFGVGTPMFFVSIGMAAFLTLFAGLMSGLTVGYLSINQIKLEIKMRNGTELDKKQGNIIMPVLHKHHELLCTLLLSNAIAMEALPLFLDAVVPAWAAVLISTTCVLLFGEVFPQALCTGPNQMWIATKSTPIVKFLMFAYSPIVIPLAKLLDIFLGTHGAPDRFEKEDLVTFIQMHQGSKLDPTEVTLLTSIASLKNLTCEQVSVKASKIFMLSENDLIEQKMIDRITKRNFSKIPIYSDTNRNKIIGILPSKSLIAFATKYNSKTIKESGIKLHSPLIVPLDTPLLALLYLFKKQKITTALIRENFENERTLTNGPTVPNSSLLSHFIVFGS